MDNIKPLNGKAYGHIPHLPNSRIGEGDHKINDGQTKIATEQVRDYKDLIIVQEKLDGANCAIAKINNQLHFLSRSGYLANQSSYEHHRLFAFWCKERYDLFDSLLKEGERIIGEWLALAHGTIYKLKHEPFVVFDIMIKDKRLCYIDFLNRVLPYQLVTPRLIHIGQPISVKRVLKVLEPSGHGADSVEGAVWRIEREGRVDFLCKYVRHEKIDGLYLKDNIWNWKE